MHTLGQSQIKSTRAESRDHFANISSKDRQWGQDNQEALGKTDGVSETGKNGMLQIKLLQQDEISVPQHTIKCCHTQACSSHPPSTPPLRSD